MINSSRQSFPRLFQSFALRRTLGRVMQYDESLPEGLVEDFWRDPNPIASAGQLLSGTVRLPRAVRVEYGRQSFVLKRYVPPTWHYKISHAFVRSRARRCWIRALQLIEAGIRTPLPVAYLEERWGPLRGHSFFLYKYAPGTSLDVWLQRHRPTPSQVDDIAEQFLDFWHSFAELGICHTDMHLGNFVIGRENALWVIDLDSVRYYRRRSALQRSREKRLALFLEQIHQLRQYATPFVTRIRKAA